MRARRRLGPPGAHPSCVGAGPGDFPVNILRARADLTSARLAAASPRADAAALALPAAASPATARDRSPVLGALGGALVGGAFSYLVSQLAWNKDWDSGGNAENGRRMAVMAGGGALGALGGALLSHRTPGEARTRAGAADFADAAITTGDIRNSTAVNAYELVQALRPQWLRVRVATSHPSLDPNPTTRVGGAPAGAEQGPMPTTPVEDPNLRANDESRPDARRGVRVFVERSLRGDVNTLRDILTSQVTSIEFLDTAQAAYRLGLGNPSGAIVVHISSSSR